MSAVARESLPPGPRFPRALQTAGFMLAAPRFLEACRRRYGGAVTFSTLFDSPFVMTRRWSRSSSRNRVSSCTPARPTRCSGRCSASARCCCSTEPSTCATGTTCAREGEDSYLDAVVKESLRIRPVLPAVGRVVRGEPFSLGGYEVPTGVEINPAIKVIHHRADLYPDPDAFRPERFLGQAAPDTYTWRTAERGAESARRGSSEPARTQRARSTTSA